ncbi:alpha-tocopherol transfer protein-like [Bicyclus anynana]|uniref:Alpha-tocopherol transfer protein-like n=1 Tax=Bicyclus anynana TaxID=110368 RepID=A0A6J1NQH1_BICAN|nr:alpha-tocopherol transfer protein-like [Bicyclus anynana]
MIPEIINKHRAKPGLIFEYNPDTLEYLKKQYDLDSPERLDEAFIILQDWLDKQPHIVRKKYSKDYLERIIILSKGSVERAKMKLDSIATYRTLLPQFFEPLPEPAKLAILEEFHVCFLPKMTKDHYRVFWIQSFMKQSDGSTFMDFYRFFVMLCEYLLRYDYCNGYIAVLDYRKANIFELLKTFNVMEIHQVHKIVMDGFGMRIKAIHFITTSKAIDTLITICKQVLKAKVAERIQVHKVIDDLYKFIPKETMPADYGGLQKSTYQLCCDLKSTIGSEDNLKYFKEMQKACTNENYRCADQFNDKYLGLPGSFRKLNVD